MALRASQRGQQAGRWLLSPQKGTPVAKSHWGRKLPVGNPAPRLELPAGSHRFSPESWGWTWALLRAGWETRWSVSLVECLPSLECLYPCQKGAGAAGGAALALPTPPACCLPLPAALFFVWGGRARLKHGGKKLRCQSRSCRRHPEDGDAGE